MSESCDKTIDFEGFWRGSPKSSFEKRVGGGGWVGVAIIFWCGVGVLIILLQQNKWNAAILLLDNIAIMYAYTW